MNKSNPKKSARAVVSELFDEWNQTADFSYSPTHAKNDEKNSSKHSMERIST